MARDAFSTKIVKWCSVNLKHSSSMDEWYFDYDFVKCLKA